MRNYGLSSLGNSLGSLVGYYMNGNTNPYGSYKSTLSEIPPILHQYYDPYIKSGSDALGNLQSQFNSLINNPSKLLSSFGETFRSSPGYQYGVNEAIKAANRLSAAHGMLGSPAEKMAIARNVKGLADQDYNNYLSNIMNLYGHGLSGLGGIESQGLNASSNLGSNLAQIIGARAKADEEESKMKSQKSSALGGILGNLLGSAASFFL